MRLRWMRRRRPRPEIAGDAGSDVGGGGKWNKLIALTGEVD
jgi:hypothetical protein